MPPPANDAFVWRMEDILDVSTRSDAPPRPVVGRAEQPKHLLRPACPSLPAAPGGAARVDDGDERGGVKLVLPGEPRPGHRWVTVTVPRTKRDWAPQLHVPVAERDPPAERIVLIPAKLNPHTPAALAAAFPPAAAKRRADKRELPYTSQHGSWRNVAEIAWSGLGRQCLDRRRPAVATRQHEVAAGPERRNATGGPVNWRFTTANARSNLKRLDPSIEE